jgi:SnoaL-like protein
MKRMALLGAVLAAGLAGCGGGSGDTAPPSAEAQKQADLYAIDQIERTWHKASSTHNVDLMMSLWAPDATDNTGTATLTGAKQIRDFFEHKVGAFQPVNHWVSVTPAFKIRTTVNGDKGTLYFECVYIDLKTQKVVSVVGADQNVQKINGKWLITSSIAASPKLGP